MDKHGSKFEQSNKAVIQQKPFLLCKEQLGAFVSSQIYDKRDDFDSVNFIFRDGDILCATSYGVYMDRVKRIWYLAPVRAVSQEEPSDRKPDPWPF